MENIMSTKAEDKKVNLSLKIDLSKKIELQKIAEKNQRSVHFLLVQAVDNFINEENERLAYDKYVEERVMTAYNEHKNGTKSIPAEEVYNEIDELLNN